MNNMFSCLYNLFISMMVKKIGEKEFNISFSILRIYLCFVVVNNHLFNATDSTNIFLLKFLKNMISVPIFFMMSFFLCHKLFSLNDKKKIKNRLERLIIPYFLWPIIFWSFNIKMIIVSFFK